MRRIPGGHVYGAVLLPKDVSVIVRESDRDVAIKEPAGAGRSRASNG